VARERLIARRIDGDAPGALLLRDVAGGVGRREQLLERAALTRDLDQSHRHADVEDAVLPHEAVVADRAADVIGDLARLLERTADQEHPELVPAQAADGVAVAHRIPQELCDLAQHAVAGQVAARVVDHLEAIEVEIAQHVLPVAAMAALDGLGRAALELAPIDKSGECIVGRLVGHLPGKSAQLGHIVQQQHGAGDLVGVVADRRGGQLDRALDAPGA